MTGFALESSNRQASLRDRLLPALGQRIGLAGLRGSLDRSAAEVEVAGADVAYTWDENDQLTTTWMPQGITTSADAFPGEEAHTILVSWYAKDFMRRDSACRLSLLDRREPGRPRYAHLHLVEPARRWWAPRAQMRRVPVHAGGIAWWGTTLLVASTHGGLRVFDLDHLVRTRSGTLLLPQSGEHRATTVGTPRPLRWSFISVDRSDPSHPWLIAGEYSREGADTRLGRFPLDPLTGRPAGDHCHAVEVIEAGISSMQGATRVNGVYHVSASSGAKRPGNLYTGGVGGFTRHSGLLPIGPEDLSYEPGADRLWTVTEYPGSRFVAGIPRPPHDLRGHPLPGPAAR